MQQMPTVKLDRPIQSATVLKNNIDAAASPLQDNETQSQKAELIELCSNFKNIIETLAGMQSELFRRHKNDIVNLAVEIARRILGHKIEQEDYQIQDIIKQALDDAPTQKNIVIRLNPKDYARIEQLTKTSKIDFDKDITLVADAGIGPAQCLLETPKGIVESLIDEHLDRISEALKKTG
jgi:flagellar assembly protein FliH